MDMTESEFREGFWCEILEKEESACSIQELPDSYWLYKKEHVKA